MHLKKDILLDAPCPELVCGLCNDILDNPMQVHCSEDHMFCRACLNNYEKIICPSCLEPIDKNCFQLSKFVKRQICRLRIKCMYHSLGCTWEGVLEDQHSQTTCQYRTVRCPNAERGCTDVINITCVNQHREQCPFELIACPNASPHCQPFLRKDTQLHATTCASFRCPYAQRGCPFIGTLPDMARHCESYCRKLHERIQHLEMECNRLKQQLKESGDKTDNNDNNTHQLKQEDTSMDEMALFHQMFNNNFLAPEANNTHPAPAGSSSPSVITNNNLQPQNAEMIDIAAYQNMALALVPPTQTSGMAVSAMPNAHDHQSSLPTSTASLNALSVQTVAPSAPKRSTTGKIIRYSRNKQLAHGALRMSRQRTPSSTNVTTEAVLQALHVANNSNNNKIKDEDIDMCSTATTTPIAATPHLAVSSSSPSISNNNKLDRTSNINCQQPQKRPQQQQKRPQRQQKQQQQQEQQQQQSASISSPSSLASKPPAHPAFSFKNLEDVTKFLEELPPETSAFLSPAATTSPSQPPTSRKTIAKAKGGNNGRRQKSNNGDNNNNNNNSNKHSTKTANQHLPADPKPVTTSPASIRPMYVLASTLLSKHSQDH